MSSASSPASWSQCSRRCWRMPLAFARPNSARFVLREGDAFRTVASHGELPEHVEPWQSGKSLRPRPRCAFRARRQDPPASPCRQICERTRPIFEATSCRSPPSIVGGRPHIVCRADAQGERVGRRHRHLPPGGPALHRQADRAGHELRRIRPSSPSRTPACSTSCANRCSSRPPPPTCSRSSAARPSICRRCSIRWSSRPHGCARRIGQPSAVGAVKIYSFVASYGFPREFEEFMRGARSRRKRTRLVGRAMLEAADRPHPGRLGRSASSRCWSSTEAKSVAIAPCSAVPLMREGGADRRGCPARAPQCGLSPTSRSNWSRPSPTRR